MILGYHFSMNFFWFSTEHYSRVLKSCSVILVTTNPEEGRCGHDRVGLFDQFSKCSPIIESSVPSQRLDRSAITVKGGGGQGSSSKAIGTACSRDSQPNGAPTALLCGRGADVSSFTWMCISNQQSRRTASVSRPKDSPTAIQHRSRRSWWCWGCVPFPLVGIGVGRRVPIGSRAPTWFVFFCLVSYYILIYSLICNEIHWILFDNPSSGLSLCPSVCVLVRVGKKLLRKDRSKVMKGERNRGEFL